MTVVIYLGDRIRGNHDLTKNLGTSLLLAVRLGAGQILMDDKIKWMEQMIA